MIDLDTVLPITAYDFPDGTAVPVTATYLTSKSKERIKSTRAGDHIIFFVRHRVCVLNI